MMPQNSVKTSSPWLDSVPDEKRFPSLSGTLNCNVVVIGGGVAGVIAAWRAAENGLSVILLEKGHIAVGDTGYTTAFVTRVPDVFLSEVEKKYGLDYVRKLFSATREAQDYLKRLIKTEKIDCDFSECSSFNCSYKSDDEFLKAEWNVVKQVETDAVFVKGSEASSSGAPVSEAIRYGGEARFDVRKFIFGLLARPLARRIRVFEESEVLDVTFGDKVLVKTSNGTITASKVVSTTGFPPKFLGDFSKVFKQHVTFAIAAQYSGKAPFTDNLFWDTEQPYYYYRLLDDKTVILGGADRESGIKSREKPHDVLTRFLDEKFPGKYVVTNKWSGSLFYSPDGLPYASPHPAWPNKVFVGSGFSGNGMVIGTLTGLILGDLAAGKQNLNAPLFSFSRTKTSIPVKEVSQMPLALNKARLILPVAYLAILASLVYVFFSNRGGLSFLSGVGFTAANALLFPLLGLLAFFLVWAQLMIGSSMDLLRKVFPSIEKFHRAEGPFALLFALLHPTMLSIGVGASAFLGLSFVDPSLVLFVWLGFFQLFLIICTAGTAIMMRHPFFKSKWRYIHFLNYVIFVSVFIHSWFLGTDVQSTPLKYLWMFFGLTAVGSTAWRVLRAWQPAGVPQPQALTAPSGGSFVRVAKASQVSEDAPFCAEVNGRAIALFKVGGKYFAIDNTCSHAGGPLCEGSLEKGVVECPLHGSRFDVKTGAVVNGPARNPQQSFPVRISGDDIEVSA